MNPKPYFSVVTPSFNQGSYIEGTIRSVLDQGVEDFEHIVFDNCSTDDTLRIVRGYPHLDWHSEKDRGQSHALNKGFQKARGEIICWLNADDQYLPGTFAALRELFRDPARHVVFGNAQQRHFDGRNIEHARGRFERREDLITWWQRKIGLHQPAIFFRRAVFEKVGPLREDLHYTMDWEYWWRASGHFSFDYIDRDFALQQHQPEAKTVLDRHAIFRERELIFRPHRGQITGRSWWSLEKEKRTCMGRRYLSYAQEVMQRDRRIAAYLLWLSVAENPFNLLTPAWLRSSIYYLTRGTAGKNSQTANLPGKT